MSHLRNVLADYLSMRRALGYKMDQVERRLRQLLPSQRIMARPMSGP